MMSGEERNGKNCDGDDNNGIMVLIQPKAFDCSICFKPLQPPVFQCKNGHAACSRCSSKPNKKCSECYRAPECCPLVESILKSITGSCQFVRFGCRETISYAQKHAHEESCPYGPCSCPMPECDFQSPVQALSAHFRSQHPKYLEESDTDILQFYFHLNRGQGFCALLSKDEYFFLLLNRHAPSGNSLSVVCIGPAGSMGEHVEYKLGVLSFETTFWIE